MNVAASSPLKSPGPSQVTGFALITRRKNPDLEVRPKSRAGIRASLEAAGCVGLGCFAIVMLAAIAVPSLAGAGTIGFRITNTVDTAAGVVVTVELTNTGNESAHRIVPTVALGDTRASGDPLAKIAPKGKHKWTIRLQEAALASGSYVMVTRVAYEDENTYPFEVLAATPFSVNHKRRRSVAGSIAIPNLTPKGSAKARLTVNVPDKRGTHFEVRVVAPSALKLDRRPHKLDASNERRIRFPIEVSNDGLLAGSTTAVFALVTSQDEAAPQTDLIRGVARIATPKSAFEGSTLIPILIALVGFLIILEIAAVIKRPSTGPATAGGAAMRLLAVIEVLLVCGTSAFLLYHYPWDALLAPTTTAGGDMGSLFYPTKLLAEEIMPSGQLTGWTMGNYAGFPVLHFYSTLPFALIVILGKLFPLLQTFKIVTLLGPTLLPVAAAYLFRCLGYGRGASIIASVSVIPFLLQQGNSMWGGNIPSVLAGEFCHSLGLTLSLVFLGVLHRTVQGKGSWPLAALLLAAIGLSHTFSFFAAVWYSLFFVWPRKHASISAPPVLAVYATTFLLLCFWGLPLPSRLVYTSEWSMIWNIKDWKEVLPEPLWPVAILSLLNAAAMLVRVKEFRVERQGLLLFIVGGGALLYLVVPALGFPDIRFIPVSQLFICLLAADFIFWVGSSLRFPLVFASCILIAGLAWGQAHLGYIPSWLQWNYSGYEGKATWKLFKNINDHVRGDVNDPRVMFEHSQAHNRFGTSRAFENLPLFSGRSTLEGVFHQASQNSPFIFYLQSELSKQGSGPFPQYTYKRLNPDEALPHLRTYNTSDIIVVSDEARRAYDKHPAFERTLQIGSYAVYHVAAAETGYVVAADNEPVLYDGLQWKLAFYRWFKHHELLDIPLVPAELIGEEAAREFALRTDSIKRLPREPYQGQCDITSHLEQYRIVFDTSCPGRPHIVKVSYFPRWHATDDTPIYLVSPGFMLITPTLSHVEIEYRRNLIDWLGLAISLLGLALLGACWLRPRFGKAVQSAISAPFVGLLVFFEHHRLLLSVVFVGSAIAGGVTTRMALRAPDQAYAAAQEAYRARHFDETIERLEAWLSVDRDTFKQATALYQLGVAYTQRDQHAAAITTHERLRFEFPNVDYGAGTLYHLAHNYAALEEGEEARHYASLLAEEHPEASWLKRLRREHPEIFSPDETSQDVQANR